MITKGIDENIASEFLFIHRMFYKIGFVYYKDFTENINSYSYVFSDSPEKKLKPLNFIVVIKRPFENSPFLYSLGIYFDGNIAMNTNEYEREKFKSLILEFNLTYLNEGKDSLIDFLRIGKGL